VSVVIDSLAVWRHDKPKTKTNPPSALFNQTESKLCGFQQKKKEPSSQALPGYRITAPPSVCVPDVIGALAVWTQQQQRKKREREKKFFTRQPKVGEKDDYDRENS